MNELAQGSSYRAATPIGSLVFIRSVTVRLAATVVFFTAVSSPAWTQTVKIVGLGATTCSQFIWDIGQDPALQRDYLAWAQGFMSGMIMSSPPGIDEGLDLVPADFPLLKQLDFMREYCVRNSADGFVDAVNSLHKRLRELNGP